MNIVQIQAKLYGDEETSRRLAAALGNEGTVVFNAETGISDVSLEVTAEGDVTDVAREAIDHLDRLARESGIEYPECVSEFTIHAEELIAIAGNLHRRGSVVPVASPPEI